MNLQIDRNRNKLRSFIFFVVKFIMFVMSTHIIMSKIIIYLTLPGMKIVSSRKKMGEVTSTHKYAPMYQKVIRRMSEK